MVRVSVLAGPYAGQVVEAPFGLVTPQDILCGVASYRYPWATDYSDATDDERNLWESQELSMKLVRALATGATVSFLEKEYRSDGINGAFEVASRIEEDILESKKVAYFESESDDRVILGAR
jgi:hypothetical protein